MSEGDEVFPEQEHPSEVTMWREGDVVLFRLGSFAPTYEWTAQEAREVGLALQELADGADS